MPALAGIAVFLGMYAVIVWFQGAAFGYSIRFEAMHAIESHALAEDFWGSLLNAHANPPLINVLYGLTDRLGSSAPVAGQFLYAALTLATIWLLCDALQRSGITWKFAAGAGVLYALLPGTFLWQMWFFTTTPIAFFAMLTVWGVTLCVTSQRRMLGAVAATVGLLGLFLIRATFTWFLVLLAMGFIVVVLRRGTQPSQVRAPVATVLVGGIIVLLVQGHYLLRFDQWTLSSWSGANITNGLVLKGLTVPQEEALAAENDCWQAHVTLGGFADPSLYTACPRQTFSGEDSLPRVLAASQRTAPDIGPNYYDINRWALSKAGTDFALTALSRHPEALLRLALGSNGVDGSLGLFLGPSEREPTGELAFGWITMDSSWPWELQGVWSRFFPPVAWLLIIASGVRWLVVRPRRTVPPQVLFAVGMLVLHAVPSVLGEYGENQRFRSEMDAVLMFATTIALVSFVKVRKRVRS
jgi:hypothetical protein